jgi:HemY protein
MRRQMRVWRQKRRAARARRATQRGLIELAEGHWARAERDLVRHAKHSETALLNYLGAARAAQKQDADGRRDHYLSMAHHAMPEAELAVGLTQAEVQLSGRQLEQALATLRHLRTIAPRHAHVLYLLKRLYEQLESWGDLAELLPDLRRNKVMEAAELEKLEQKTHVNLLRLAAATGSAQQLRQAWEAMPRELHRLPEVVGYYAEQLDCLGESQEAERTLKDYLKRDWDPRVVRLYGMIQAVDTERQLATAESWGKKRERDPALLLTLGRLAVRDRLWGKARAYFEASLGLEPLPETYRELGALLDQMNEHELARECFRKGLDAAVGGLACAVQMEPPPKREALPAGTESTETEPAEKPEDIVRREA